MIRMLLPGVSPAITGQVLDVPAIRDFLYGIETTLPGLDLTWDRAVGIGMLAVDEVRAGRREEHLALAAKTFDRDEFAKLIDLAMKHLAPLCDPDDDAAPTMPQPQR